ncbi:MAG: hypothetical protein LCH37_02955 [Bacteroidetes bacterium]|nr:hypothetical protein [Bacteroidota bacterium]
MEQKKHMVDIHQSIKGWLSDLSFYQEELVVLVKRLEEVAARNTSKELLSRVEHFQNLFIRQREVIDEFKHELNEQESELVATAISQPVASDRIIYKEPSELAEKFDTFVRLYKEMKVEFEGFLARSL